jgi:A/G-specific adenine glycosylase
MRDDVAMAVGSSNLPLTDLPNRFATHVVSWQRSHGRHDLPWQNTRDPYRVWLSEIMLQQTQVSTVMDYFAKFLQRFPTVAALAAGHSDEVFGLWSGLGYYSRARNLHRCAQDVVALHGGVFPRTAQALQTLPGIGPSTAAAIASLCFEERVAILDGNVRRVLTRYLGYGADLSQSANEKVLWGHANRVLPPSPQDMPTYTQGVMDLGATLCVRRKPLCLTCPLRGECVAFAQGQAEHYPVKTRKLKRSTESMWLLQATNEQGAVWLAQRPETGVWAKLYCLPVFASAEALDASLSHDVRHTAVAAPPFVHVLTHKDLYLHAVFLRVNTTAWAKQFEGQGQWVAADVWPRLGLPAPVRKLLENAG